MKNNRFWFGIFAGLVLSGLVGFLVLPFLGLFPVSATGKPNILDWWGHTNLESFLERKSPETKIPAEADPVRGFELYLVACLHCHGGPHAKRETWANHMLPKPPKLWKEGLQKEVTDGELFYVIANGIRMTGMPAFGPIHSDKDIWNVVAFVRQLGQLTEQQQQVMREAAAKLHHVGGHNEDDAEDNRDGGPR